MKLMNILKDVMVAKWVLIVCAYSYKQRSVSECCKKTVFLTKKY